MEARTQWVIFKVLSTPGVLPIQWNRCVNFFGFRGEAAKQQIVLPLALPSDRQRLFAVFNLNFNFALYCAFAVGIALSSDTKLA
ncbi:MAG: hypothetical protein OIF34_07890, partial [Porticoccaceae bacterium]|nr:hypothetical protein [Porticoccaceae bacterium]